MSSSEEEGTHSESEFSRLLQLRLKKGLTPTQTKVMKEDGSVTYFQGKGLVKTTTSTSSGYGFVVDTKPDLTFGQVKPWLLVSSQDVAAEPQILKEFGVTHILSLLPGFTLIPSIKSEILEHCVLDFLDEECFDIVSSAGVETALNFIQIVKETGGKVLVHCNAGISRAPTIVILYLMKCEGMSFDDAIDLVKSVRPGIRPNSGFIRQLKEFGQSQAQKEEEG